MGSSLQDQLRQAGLVSEERARDESAGKRARARRRQTASSSRVEDSRPNPPPRSDPARSRAVARDPYLSGKQRSKTQKQQLHRELLELVESHKLNDANAERAFYFRRGKRLKRIYVTDEQRLAIIAGELVIAGLAGDHYLLPPDVAQQLQRRSPESFLYRAAAAGDGDDDGSHPVPDDLVW